MICVLLQAFMGVEAIVGPSLMTPAERFSNLEDWDYETKYVNVNPGDLKMAYVEEGPSDGQTILLVHGNPTWGYSFRDMLPPLVEAGYHVIVPDLIGFGRSEKPVLREDQNYSNQVKWVRSFIKALDLKNINIFCQDWGGLIALRIIANNQNLFDSVLLSNAGLPTNSFDAGEQFDDWQNFISQTIPDFSFVIQLDTIVTLSDEEIRAYQAPFPDNEEGYKAAPRQLPRSLPTTNLPIRRESFLNRKALFKLRRFNKPFLTVFSTREANVAETFINNVRGARGLPHKAVENIGHFSQDEIGAELAQDMINLIEEYVN
jgi:haloalkane dehalogenase